MSDPEKVENTPAADTPAETPAAPAQAETAPPPGAPAAPQAAPAARPGRGPQDRRGGDRPRRGGQPPGSTPRHLPVPSVADEHLFGASAPSLRELDKEIEGDLEEALAGLSEKELLGGEPEKRAPA